MQNRTIKLIEKQSITISYKTEQQNTKQNKSTKHTQQNGNYEN